MYMYKNKSVVLGGAEHHVMVIQKMKQHSCMLSYGMMRCAQ